MWKIVFTDEFDKWFLELTADEQDSILYYLNALKEKGHQLGKPYVDTIKGSSLNNLKELRVQHNGSPYRIFFIFDPIRQAVMLCGGDKSNDKRFYQTMIPLAESIYQNYLISPFYLNLIKENPMRTLDDIMASLPKKRQDKIYAKTAQFLLELAELRKKAGLSQTELANKMGVSQSAVSQIESHNNLQLDTLANYVQALGGRLKLSIEF